MSIYIFLIIIFNLLLLTKSQFWDKDVLKAASCVTLLKKIPNKPQDNKIITYYLLACFINIDEETANKIFEMEHYDNLGIEESQIIKLLDINSIQRQYTQEQINDFSNLLNKALESLKSVGKSHDREKSDGSYDYDNDQKADENNGLINYIIKLFTSSDSLIFLVILFAIFYYILQKMRKCIKKNDKDDNNKKSNKKNNKINKKKKK